MRTALITHEACLLHEPPAGHPERPARLSAVLRALKDLPLERVTAPPATREAILRAHAVSLVDSVLAPFPEPVASNTYRRIDADTVMSPGSAEAALRAAGAAICAVDRIMAGTFDRAFCAVRPPGHHAERARPMGFCLFNNVVVGALHACAAFGLKRVAVVDFDVHHGNGTQHIFWNEPNLFYASTHQMPLYPGTGYREERGTAGNIVNCPLLPGSGSAEFRRAYIETILPELRQFAPEFIFISAGFDAHRADPLANLHLSEDDFFWVTREICAVAREVCGGRVVSLFEGGYDLPALAASAAAHVQALMET